MPKITLLPQDFNQHPGIYLTALLLAVIALFYITVMNPLLSQPISATNYEECSVLPSSRILEKYPPVCMTEDGQQFTMKLPQSSMSATPQSVID